MSDTSRVVAWLALGVVLCSGFGCDGGEPSAQPDSGSAIGSEGGAGAGASDGAEAAGTAGAGQEMTPEMTPPDLPGSRGVPCNSAPALCDKRYSALSFLATHSSLASDASWDPQTQGRTLRDQLLPILCVLVRSRRYR